MTTVSVLICTYNRSDLLAGALQALVVGSIHKPDQVVVVNGGDERADAVVRRFQALDLAPVELVKTVNRNLAASRNIGLAHCTGDIVAMTDDDAEVFPDWIAQLKAAHAAHPEAGAIGGAVLGAASGHSFLSRLSDATTFRSAPMPGYVRTLPGVNVSYKGEVVRRLGPQDEALFRGEDVDYNWRVLQLGYRVYYDPALRVLHHHRPNLRQYWRQHYMYGRAYYLVRRKWPEMYSVYPHGIRRFRDLLRLGNFFASMLYEPITVALRLPAWPDRLRAIPVLLINHLAWKWGMVEQAVRVRQKAANTAS